MVYTYKLSPSQMSTGMRWITRGVVIATAILLAAGWISPPFALADANTPAPGAYVINRDFGQDGSWRVTLTTIEVKNNGTMRAIISYRKLNPSAGPLHCPATPSPDDAYITLTNGRRIQLIQDFCSQHRGEQLCCDLVSWGDFPTSDRGASFTLFWYGWGTGVSGITLGGPACTGGVIVDGQCVPFGIIRGPQPDGSTQNPDPVLDFITSPKLGECIIEVIPYIKAASLLKKGHKIEEILTATLPNPESGMEAVKFIEALVPHLPELEGTIPGSAEYLRPLLAAGLELFLPLSCAP